jgi:hypothetical protein
MIIAQRLNRFFVTPYYTEHISHRKLKKYSDLEIPTLKLSSSDDRAHLHRGRSTSTEVS